MIAALQTIVAACKKNGIRAALHCGTPDYAARAIGWGFDMTTVGGDSRFLAAAAGAAVAGFRKLTETRRCQGAKRGPTDAAYPDCGQTASLGSGAAGGRRRA